MEVKKSPKANLENKRTLFLEIGFILTLVVVFAAFQFSSTETSVSIIEAGPQEIIEEEDIPVTSETPPPPPEQPQIPVVSDIIDIVDDEIEIDNNIISLEDRPDLAVDIIDYASEIYEEDIEEEAIPFAFVEEKPKFMGDDPNAFTKWVSSNLEYPEIAKENAVQGRVLVEFTVNVDGSVSNIKVLRGVDSSLDKEAVRVISQSPKWTPGRQRDKAVKVVYRFPVIFQLK